MSILLFLLKKYSNWKQYDAVCKNHHPSSEKIDDLLWFSPLFQVPPLILTFTTLSGSCKYHFVLFTTSDVGGDNKPLIMTLQVLTGTAVNKVSLLCLHVLAVSRFVMCVCVCVSVAVRTHTHNTASRIVFFSEGGPSRSSSITRLVAGKKWSPRIIKFNE